MISDFFTQFVAGQSKEALIVMNGISWKLLMVLNCLNSLSSVGVLYDAVITGKDCTKINIQYFQKTYQSKEENDSKNIESKASNEVTASTRL